MTTISRVDAQEILDSRGNPTVLATVTTASGLQGQAAAPSGASKGEHEACEKRDEDPRRFLGKGVLSACASITGPIQKFITGKSIFDQSDIDQLMIEKDGTENKSLYGANAIVAVSLAVATCAAKAANMPLYRYLGGLENCVLPYVLPCPMLNILNGGAHADNSLDFQEFMIRPHGFSSFSEALRAGVEVFHTLKALLKKASYQTNVGDEGGFAPNLASDEEALSLISEAIEKAGYKVKQEISLAIDCAATEFFDTKANKYIEKKKMKKGLNHSVRSASEQVAYLEKLCASFAIDSIEDGLAENDWDGWKVLTQRLGEKVQIVGDDIFVTNPKFLLRGINEGVANAILIKFNQIGTLTETLETIRLAQNSGYRTVISHRSGETEDSFIADLAVGCSSGQIKTGAPSRSERVVKYNRLLQIEKELGSAACYNQS